MRQFIFASHAHFAQGITESVALRRGWSCKRPSAFDVRRR